LHHFPTCALCDLEQLAFLIRCCLVDSTDPKIENSAFYRGLPVSEVKEITMGIFNKEVISE
jgi:hypothetical protein